MTPDNRDLQMLAERVAKLEQQNKRLKRIGSVAGIVLSCIALMGQTSPQGGTVEAREFLVKNSEGRTLAKLGGPPEYGLVIYNEHGQAATVLTASSLLLSDSVSRGNSVLIVAGDEINTLSTTGWLTAQYNISGNVATLSTTRIALGQDTEHTAPPRVSLEADANGARLRISDKQGFASVMGNADLETERTGETHRTSGAALVLFDKSGKVIWHAP